jgi:DNA-binding LacI/PurR family transcriptional regulator
MNGKSSAFGRGRHTGRPPGNGPTQYELIAEHLRRQILTGELQPGDLMPTERKLAGIYDVTVKSVRRAQQLLVDEGLISKEQGRGTFVTDRARKERRALLVCGLDFPSGAEAPEMASPYFLHTIRYCRQAARRRGLALETVWVGKGDELPPAATLAGPVSGYIFVACNIYHMVVRKAAAERAHHVHLGKTAIAERSVWFPIVIAGQLAWETLQDEVVRRELPVVAVSVGDENVGASVLAEKVPGGVRHLSLNNTVTAWEAEQWGYRSVLGVCARNPGPTAFVFFDEILARGGTRALLQAGLGDGRCPVVVVSGKQEMMPYGLPVTYITHDTETEAEWAVEMLLDQLEGRDGGTEPRMSEFVVEQIEEVSSDQSGVIGEEIREGARR